MKYKLLFLFLIIPLLSFCRTGYHYRLLNGYYGIQHNLQSAAAHNFSLSYDFAHRNCTSRSSYMGLELNVSLQDKFIEYGLNTMYNPTRLNLHVARPTYLLPFLFAGVKFRQPKEAPDLTDQTRLKAGLGITAIHNLSNRLALRATFLLGHMFNRTVFKENLTATFNLGIGFRIKK